VARRTGRGEATLGAELREAKSGGALDAFFIGLWKRERLGKVVKWSAAVGFKNPQWFRFQGGR
jgi:hypothetical protein